MTEGDYTHPFSKAVTGALRAPGNANRHELMRVADATAQTALSSLN
jgi:hypothetical protein